MGVFFLFSSQIPSWFSISHEKPGSVVYPPVSKQSPDLRVR
jgi:hypothetical protein